VAKSGKNLSSFEEKTEKIEFIDDIKFLSVRGESFAPKQTFKHKDTIFSANNKKMFQKIITIKIIVKNFAKFQFFC